MTTLNLSSLLMCGKNITGLTVTGLMLLAAVHFSTCKQPLQKQHEKLKVTHEYYAYVGVCVCVFKNKMYV